MAIYDPHFGGYRIFVGDLGRQTTRYDIEREYERYGQLVDVWVARNPPGFAFIVFKNIDECERAVRKSHGRRLCGRRVRVEYARPFDDRTDKQKLPNRPRYRSRSPRRYASRSRSRSRSSRRRHRASSGSKSPQVEKSRDRRNRRSHRSRSRSESVGRRPSRYTSERLGGERRSSERSQSTTPELKPHTPPTSEPRTPNQNTSPSLILANGNGETLTVKDSV